MPKINFDTLESIPEGLREHAVQQDGSFVIDVAPTAKLGEFRENNIRIAQERDTLVAFRNAVAPIVGDDPAAFAAQYRELSEIAQKVKDGTLKASDAVTAEIEARVASMRAGFENQLRETSVKLTQAEQKQQAAEAKFRQTLVNQAVTAAAANEMVGVLPSAIPDILERASRVFKVDENGKIVAKDNDLTIYGVDGVSSMTPLEWLTGTLRQTAPHFYKNSSGGGATGGNTAGDARFGGMAEADFRKLTPEQKLSIANKMAASKRR